MAIKDLGQIFTSGVAGQNPSRLTGRGVVVVLVVVVVLMVVAGPSGGTQIVPQLRGVI